MDTTDITCLIDVAAWHTPVDPEPTREAWLLAGIDRMARSTFPTCALPKWRVATGWPKGSRGSSKTHSIGQCWDRASSEDGSYEIFISPELDHPVTILATLAHEMVHAIVGCDAGHKGEFPALCKKIGLVKPWTATSPSPELLRSTSTPSNWASTRTRV
jgi:hypothetical protein